MSPPAEGVRAVQFLGKSMAAVVYNLNHVIKAIQGFGEAVGDVSMLGGVDLTQAVLDARSPPQVVEELRAKIDTFEGLLSRLKTEVGDDIVASGQVAITLVQDCLSRLQVLEDSPIVRPTVSSFPRAGVIGSDTLLTDATGNAFSVEMILQELQECKAARLSQAAIIQKLQADVVSQGGVSFNGKSYHSEQDIRAIVMAEAPGGEGMAAFPTASSIFVHDESYEPATKGTWRDLVKPMLKSQDYEDAECKLVASNGLRYPAHYAGTGTVKAGKLLAAFSSQDTWDGCAGITGRREEITASIETATLALATYAQDHLPGGGRLLLLSQAMASKTVAWFGKVHPFFDKDIKQLTELGVSKEAALRLISEYVIIMFDRFYLDQQKLMKWTKNVTKADYLIRVVWISLLVHQAMESFLTNGNMKYNSSLSAAFLRHLTSETAQNNAASFEKRVTALEKSDPKKVDVAVKAAQTSADKAHTELVKVRSDITKLQQRR